MNVDRTDEFLESLRSFEKRNVVKLAAKNMPNNIVENGSSEFKCQSVKLLESIFNLREMLGDILQEHVSFSQIIHSKSSSKCLEMEINSERLMKLCQDCLNNIRSTKYFPQTISQDIKYHRKAVTEMLGTYLKRCHKIYEEINDVKMLKQNSQKIGKNCFDNDQDGSIIDFHGGFGQAQLDIYQIEQLQVNSDGVHQRMILQMEEKAEIEKRIGEISRLNEKLTESVFEQHSIINRIEDSSLNVNLNVDCGNDELKKAMQNQSSTRFWILFILIVLSVSLLFIDWYNS